MGANAEPQPVFLAQTKWWQWRGVAAGEGDQVLSEWIWKAELTGFPVGWMWGGVRGTSRRGRLQGFGVRPWKGALSTERERRAEVSGRSVWGKLSVRCI